MSTLDETLRLLSDRQQELHERLREAEQRAATAEQRAAQLSIPKLVDTRALGKPRVFSGNRAEWATWAFSFTSFLAGATPAVLEALKWAELQQHPIPNTPRPGDSTHQEHWQHSRQLYLALALQVDDKSDATIKIMNTADNNGLEAWRVLK
eukprot:1680032-Amphidinium_carterae.1